MVPMLTKGNQHTITITICVHYSNKEIISNFAGLRNAKNAKLRASQGADANLEPGNAIVKTQAGQELVARRDKDATGAKGDSTSVGMGL
jgi:hypothetical protein